MISGVDKRKGSETDAPDAFAALNVTECCPMRLSDVTSALLNAAEQVNGVPARQITLPTGIGLEATVPSISTTV